MKQLMKLMSAVLVLCLLTACGSKSGSGGSGSQSGSSEQSGSGETDSGEWTRTGYFKDSHENFINISVSEDPVNPGYAVTMMVPEGLHGWIIRQEGNVLKGNLNYDQNGEPFNVTIAEEGDNGLLVTLENGTEYHFTLEEQTPVKYKVTINTNGFGVIAYAEGTAEPEFDELYPFTSVLLNLPDAAEYTIAAKPDDNCSFVRWTKNGEEFSTEEKLTLTFDESAEYIAEFEYNE